MKLIITGGAGFLGYHLCNQLSGKYKEIFILDIAPIDPKEYPVNVRYFNVDIRDLLKLNEIFKDGDIVIHAAAAFPLWKTKDIFDINVNGIKNVLQAAIDNNIKRVVYISSTAVYGIPKEHPIYEDNRLIGVGAYGESKIEAEKICEDYKKRGYVFQLCDPRVL